MNTLLLPPLLMRLQNVVASPLRSTLCFLGLITTIIGPVGVLKHLVVVTNFSSPLLVDGKLLPKPELRSPTVT